MNPLSWFVKKDQYTQNSEIKAINVGNKNYNYSIDNNKKILSLKIDKNIKATDLNIHLSKKTFEEINNAETDAKRNEIIGRVIVESEELYKITSETLKKTVKDRSVFKITDKNIIVYTKKEGLISRLFNLYERQVFVTPISREIKQIDKIQVLEGQAKDPESPDQEKEAITQLFNIANDPNTPPSSRLVVARALKHIAESKNAKKHNCDEAYQLLIDSLKNIAMTAAGNKDILREVPRFLELMAEFFNNDEVKHKASEARAAISQQLNQS